MDLFELLSALSGAAGIGNVNETEQICRDYLGDTELSRDKNGNITAFKKGKNDRTLLLDAHIDEVGFIVTHVEGSFLTVSSVGGIDARILAGQRVRIYGRKTIKGVFCSTPPHLKENGGKLPGVTDIKIDTGLDDASAVVSPGDFAVYDCGLIRLHKSRVTGKALDNRAGAAAVLTAFKALKDPPVNVAMLLSAEEELGCRGAGVGGFALQPYAAIAVDVSFGNFPGLPEHKTGRLGGGAMIGISPVLNGHMTDRLISLGGTDPYTPEIMGGKTGTNADVISLTREGVPTALLSIPLRNMHTPAEVVDLKDIEAVSSLIVKYIESEGIR